MTLSSEQIIVFDIICCAGLDSEAESKPSSNFATIQMAVQLATSGDHVISKRHQILVAIATY